MALSSVQLQMKALVKAWLSQVKRADAEKRAFNAVADQCKSFAGGKSSSNFMWKPQYKEKYIGKGIKSPKFEVSILKGFEYLSIVGPLLYWEYPDRRVSTTEQLNIDMSLLMGQDPKAQEYGKFLSQQQEQDEGRSKIRCELYQNVLNYIQREQPGGGLAAHSKLAINEALIKGRGVVWTEKYQFPGSGRSLVGSFYDTVANLFIDPDCSDPTLTKAKWIARRRYTPYWELEKKFKLPKNYLRERGKYESGASQAKTASIGNKTANPSKDLVEWYEIYSRCGVGVRIDGIKTSMDDAWDEVCGDYCYLAVCEHCESPLNAPSDAMSDENLTDEAVAEMFEWPIPLWTDDKWPVSQLDFYQDDNTAWPIAPLSPAMGELTCLNILIACYVEQAYESRQQIVAYMSSAAQEVEAALKSDTSTVYIKLNDSVQRSISEVISFLNRNPLNNNLLEAIQFLMTRFEERTGLSEIMYGSQGTKVDRSAEASRNRNDRASIRPDYMAKVVSDWQSAIAEKEKIALRFCVTSEDVAPHLGPKGAYAWRMLVEMEDPEIVVRQMKCTISASDIRKPDKARESANMQQLTNQVLPVISQIASTTGNYEQLNAFITSLGESIEQDVSGWLVPPPEPDEEQMQMQMQTQAAELEKVSADADAKRADAELKRSTIAQSGEGAQHDIEMDHAKTQQQMQLDQAKSQQQMQLDQAKSQQQMQRDATASQMKMAIEKNAAMQKMASSTLLGNSSLHQAASSAAQQMHIDSDKARQEMVQSEAEFRQRMSQSNAESRQRMSQSKAESKVNKKKGSK